jgi:MFS family permease
MIYTNYWLKFKKDMPLMNCFRETIAAAMFGIFGGTFYPFLGIFLVKMGGSPLQLGLLGCAPFVGNLAAPYWAKFAKRARVIPLLVLIHLISRLLIIPIGFIQSTWIITILILAHFIIASMGGPAYFRLLQRIYPTPIRGRVMSTVRFALGATQSLTIIAAGTFLDDYAGWLFMIGGLIGIASLLPFSMIKEPDDAEETVKMPKKGYLASLRSLGIQMKQTRGFLLFLTAFMLFEIGNFLPIAVYPMFQLKVLHMESEQVALIGMLWMAAWCITYPLWGYLTDKIGPVIVLISGIVLLMTAPLAYAVTHAMVVLLIVSALAGAASSAIDVSWINTLMRMGENKVTETSSIHMLLSGIRGATIPLLGSLLYPVAGGTVIFAASAVCMIIALVPIILLWKRLRSTSETPIVGSNMNVRIRS